MQLRYFDKKMSFYHFIAVSFHRKIVFDVGLKLMKLDDYFWVDFDHF